MAYSSQSSEAEASQRPSVGLFLLVTHYLCIRFYECPFWVNKLLNKFHLIDFLHCSISITRANQSIICIRNNFFIPPVILGFSSTLS